MIGKRKRERGKKNILYKTCNQTNTNINTSTDKHTNTQTHKHKSRNRNMKKYTEKYSQLEDNKSPLIVSTVVVVTYQYKVMMIVLD